MKHQHHNETNRSPSSTKEGWENLKLSERSKTIIEVFRLGGTPMNIVVDAALDALVHHLVNTGPIDFAVATIVQKAAERQLLAHQLLEQALTHASEAPTDSKWAAAQTYESVDVDIAHLAATVLPLLGRYKALILEHTNESYDQIQPYWARQY